MLKKINVATNYLVKVWAGGVQNFSFDEGTEDIFTFSTRSFFCGLNFRVALLLIGCTRHMVAQLLEAIFGGIFLILPILAT